MLLGQQRLVAKGRPIPGKTKPDQTRPDQSRPGQWANKGNKGDFMEYRAIIDS